MGDKTKIDWCDSSWNPVTGCLHGCEYCYARKFTHRYAGHDIEGAFCTYFCAYLTKYDSERVELDKPMHLRGKKAPYPFDFAPTLHRYRLDIPQHWKRPRNIFVCSMADLFGEWVPNSWIREVFEACEKAPQHRYLFLTKNLNRYAKLGDMLPRNASEMWFGHSYTGYGDYLVMPRLAHNRKLHRFVSIEPLLHELSEQDIRYVVELNHWIIIGAETGLRKGKVTPEKRWVDDIVYRAKRNLVPVFMKKSLRDLMGEDFRQEYPWKGEERNG